MNRLVIKSFLILLLSVVTVTAAHSQFLLVKITDQTGNVLVGETTLSGYVGQQEIDLIGQESSSCSASGPTCSPVVGNFVYNFVLDKLITDYRKALYLRQVWQKVEISYLRQSASTGFSLYQKITLEDVRVVGLTESTNAGGQPTAQVKLDPVKITWAYTTLPQTGPGTTRTFNYNRATGSSF